VTSLPLSGRRILVTRAAHQAGKLSDGLRALGAEPVEVPILEIRPPASFAALDAALERLETYNWLILTSANTVRVLSARASELGVQTLQPPALMVAAIGEATAASAQHTGIILTLVPVSYVAESLIESLGGSISGQKILLARAETARDLIPDALRAAGAEVDVVDAYRNVLPESAPEQLRHALAGRIDAATFTSSSSVTHLAEAAHRAGIDFPFVDIPAISIGPITSQTLRDSGWPPTAEGNPFDIPGLISAVVRVLNPGTTGGDRQSGRGLANSLSREAG
jgi:uroporphyrinogen-III synthase/uroporphyrinogen III methyltransferase/synthase